MNGQLTNLITEFFCYQIAFIVTFKFQLVDSLSSVFWSLSTEAVSYTHLDVYKRQLFDTTTRLRLKRTDGQSKCTLSCQANQWIM